MGVLNAFPLTSNVIKSLALNLQYMKGKIQIQCF